MNKKFKMTIPFAVLALTCGIAAGCGGCAPAEGHTHDYTQWAHDDNQHWKVCPDDNEVDESSKEDHLFVAGECECGATEQPGPVVEVKYGTVTGKVKLYKQGAYATDLTGIKVDMGNDDVEIKGSVADGAYQFTVTNVKVGAIYNLTITKTGYKPYSTEIELEEEGEEAKIGGTNGVTLQYEVFGLLCGWDSEYHDFSHANDEDPYITYLESDGSKTFDVLTKDSYNDVSASLKVEYGNSLHNWHTQGIVLKFEDGKHVIVRYHNGDQVNGNIQYVDNAWDVCPKENTLFGDDAQLNEWGEAPIHTLLNEETAAIKAGGLDLNVILKDGTLYTFFGGKFIGKYTLPAGYADKKVQVGYFAYNPANNVQFKYSISSEVPATMSTALEINVTQPQDVTGCTVTATPQKDSYEFGEQIELTFTAEEGYKLDALTVGGEDKLNAVANGKLTITADRPALAVEATFVAEEPIPLDLTVKGKKLGTTAALAAGTTVAFKGTDYSFTVGADGKIESDSVIKGRYIVVVDGYFEQEIVFDETLTEITLEYDLMENLTLAWNWGDNANLGEQNDGKLTQVSGATQWVSSKDSYDSVAITATLVSGGGRQGVFIRFKGDSYANDKYVMIQKERDAKVSWNGENNIWGNGSNLCGDTWTDYVNPLTEEDLAKIAAGEYELTLVRDKNKIYVFINGTYYDTKILDESYADMQCYVGVYCTDTPSGAQRSFKIEGVSEYLSAVTITDGTAEDAHGSLSGIPEEAVKLGETVTLTIVADEGYKFSALKVNGTDVTAQVTGTTYTFVVSGDTTIVAEFTQIVPGSINAAVSGTKLGVTEAFAEGTQVTLTCQGLEDITAELTATGLSIASIPAGVWTVNVQGYFSVQITVENETEYSQAITLEYDTFKDILGWGQFDFSKQNAEHPEIAITNDCSAILTNDTYDAVMATIYLKGEQMSANNNAGIIFRFVSDGMSDVVVVRMEEGKKVQFEMTDLWSSLTTKHNSVMATGSEYKDLIFFTGDNADAKSAEYLEAYNSGTLKLSVVRKGATFYVFLGDRYIGQKTFDAKYENAKCEVGFVSENLDNATEWKRWKVEISNELPDLSVTVNKAEMQNGSVTVSENITLGSTVTITVSPAEGYMLGDIKVEGVTLTAGSNNTYTFVATEKSYTVTATFIEVPAVEAEATVTGIGLGAASVDMNGKEITFTANGTQTKYTVTDGKVKGVLAAGEYTVSCEGFYDLTATVEEDGSFAEGTALAFEKIIFAYNLINEPESNLNDKPNVGDSTAAASDGIIKATADGRIYEWSTEQYKDVAVTVTLKSGNGNQGLVMRFNNKQQDVRVRFENTKAQWIGGEWWWGTNCIINKWDFGDGTGNANPMSEALLAKYNGEGLNLTLVRKGSMVYALVDGTFYSAQIIPYETSDVRLCLFVEDAKSGYEIPFEVSTDVDAILNAAVDTHNVLGVVGNWTVTDTTLSVNGNGYAEIAPMMDVQTKESLTIKISSSNATKQGLTYRFADGKWFGFRYEPSYIQYTEDIIIFGAAGSRLKGWTTIYNLSEEEKTAFSGDGIDLQLVRDGKCIYVMLGGNVIDKVIMGDEYATMDGVAAVTVEGGTGTAFAYEYKTGENVEVPKVYTVTASFDGVAHGYFTEVGKSLANEGDKVTVTITASQNWWSDGVWTYFPTAIVVNGQEFALTTDDLTSIEANRCTYTYTIDGITADTTVKFKVTQLDCVKGLVKVSVDGEGGTAKSDSGEDGYHWNDGCDVEMTPAEGYEIESITITKGENGTPETITEGWAGPNANGVYKYTIPYGITEPTTIVVKFKATATQPTTPGDGDEGGDTTGASAE